MFDILALSDADRYAIWSKGIAKELAYVNFYNAETIARFKALRDASNRASSYRYKKMLVTIKRQSNVDGPPSYTDTQYKKSDASIKFEQYSDKLKAHMLTAIRNGEFIVLGYQHPRGISDAPKPVPLDVWKQHNPWNGNTFKLGSTKIIDVRVTLKKSVACYFEPPAEPSLAPDMHDIRAQTIQAPQKGRPTKEGLIHKAFDWGIEHQMIDCSQSNKTIYQQTFHIIQKQWPEEYEAGKGLGDTPMRKYLTERIKANRL